MAVGATRASVQQQLLDVVIVRRGRGRFSGRLPDGRQGLVAHNLITFKSHREALDGWAMKELVGHYVSYRKLVSRSPSELLAEDQFRLYAVTARYPQNLSVQVPWQGMQAGVYDCHWGTDTIRVVVAGELPREPHNAPLHLFSASPDLVGFGGRAYQRHSPNTSGLLAELFEGLQAEGFPMPYTMEDFQRQFRIVGYQRLPIGDRSQAEHDARHAALNEGDRCVSHTLRESSQRQRPPLVVGPAQLVDVLVRQLGGDR
jgi:hypothetical protein